VKTRRYYPKRSRNVNRDANIRSLFEKKLKTLSELAQENNLTVVRIHQIVYGRANTRN
jgi:hypothetical protein